MAKATTQVKILVPGSHSMVALLGERDEFLKLVEGAFDSHILVRGNEITITGDEPEAERVAQLFEELIELIERGQQLNTSAIGRTIDMIKEEGIRPSTVLTDAVLTSRGKQVAPQTSGQKRYVDALRRATLTFSIGPAGTGKTYLAVATAVRALQAREVSRIILSRPAVEAGERLGFLPGTLYEKIDPYMRPLYDALYEMLDPDAFSRLMDRGTIEVAPLAFLRGRAQPYYSQVLTPAGFRPIGSLRVGDLVIGSNGKPTRVLGIYPQGVKEVFEVRSQDGGSTFACGDHLWAVSTPEDKRRGKPPRVVATKDMIGSLRRVKIHRFELPLTEPTQFDTQEVPMDPYALGLLLGDGCLTTRTTPSFTTKDAELALALEMALPEIELAKKNELDFTLRHRGKGPGGLRLANPVAAILRDLHLAGCRSAAKFVPQVYLLNSIDVRHAVLQGLLDTDGTVHWQAKAKCRVQFCTTSPQLRDDVVFLVRSLGGVAYVQTRRARGRKPGKAKGRDVHFRHDAYVIDIRLPERFPPFRLTRKAALFAQTKVARPKRYIHGIEPAGAEETLCIRVDANDSLYVTDDFLVTHNTLNDSFIILDEAQNTSPEQMKMFLTRLGFGSRAVVNGDITQIDLPPGQRSGLVVVQEILQGIEGIDFVHLTARDVIRHRLVQDIVEAYRRFGEQAEAGADEPGP